jgi:hypothetical protein
MERVYTKNCVISHVSLVNDTNSGVSRVDAGISLCHFEFRRTQFDGSVLTRFLRSVQAPLLTKEGWLPDAFYPADGVVLVHCGLRIWDRGFQPRHLKSAIRNLKFQIERTTPSRKKRVPPLLGKEGSLVDSIVNSIFQDHNGVAMRSRWSRSRSKSI